VTVQAEALVRSMSVKISSRNRSVLPSISSDKGLGSGKRVVSAFQLALVTVPFVDVFAEDGRRQSAKDRAIQLKMASVVRDVRDDSQEAPRCQSLIDPVTPGCRMNNWHLTDVKAMIRICIKCLSVLRLKLLQSDACQVFRRQCRAAADGLRRKIRTRNSLRCCTASRAQPFDLQLEAGVVSLVTLPENQGLGKYHHRVSMIALGGGVLDRLEGL